MDLSLCGAFVPIVLHRQDRLVASHERAKRQAEVLADSLPAIAEIDYLSSKITKSYFDYQMANIEG